MLNLVFLSLLLLIGIICCWRKNLRNSLRLLGVFIILGNLIVFGWIGLGLYSYYFILSLFVFYLLFIFSKKIPAIEKTYPKKKIRIFLLPILTIVSAILISIIVLLGYDFFRSVRSLEKVIFNHESNYWLDYVVFLSLMVFLFVSGLIGHDEEKF